MHGAELEGLGVTTKRFGETLEPLANLGRGLAEAVSSVPKRKVRFKAALLLPPTSMGGPPRSEGSRCDLGAMKE